MDTMIIASDYEQKIESLESQVNDLTLLVSKMEILIKHYENQLLAAKRRQFGISSERVMMDGQLQLGLFDGSDAQGEEALPEPETEEISYKRKKRKGKREEDLSGLPVERIDYELPEDKRGCPECGESINDIGVDIRRELKLIPAKVVVVEHAAHAYACHNPECQEAGEGTVVVKANAPAPLLSGSLASPSLVAHIAVQKYQNGMPLYRIEKGFQYDGVVVSRQNMANWVIKCVELYLFSIYAMLKSFLLEESVLHSDATIVQVLRETDRKPQTKSCERVYRTSGCSERKIVIYEYTETKGQEHPAKFLESYKGFLHTDGEAGYHNLPAEIMVVGCWAHVRRYWEKILKTIPEDKWKGTDAERGVAFINRLFELERIFKNLSPEERYEKRLEKSKPVADAFFEWAGNLKALPKSPLGEAVHYSLSQRKYLENFFLDGRLELSNNRAERSVKSFVIGRKNWLFSCTPDGAAASSVMYSLVETAKENNLRPYEYVKFLLEMLPNSSSGKLEDFLPWSDSIPDSCRL
jgi:transposase